MAPDVGSRYPRDVLFRQLPHQTMLVLLLDRQEIVAAVGNQKHAQALSRLGTQPVSNAPEEFAAFIRSETAKYAKVIKAAKITPE